MRKEARAEMKRSAAVFAAGTALGAVLAFFAAPVPAAFAALRYVVSASANFGNAPDGQHLTPATAAFTIGEAIAAATAGDSILIAGATDGIAVYSERVILPAGISLLGGYSLQEPAFSIRDTDHHQTEIDGLQETSSGSVITVASGAGRSTLIEGLRIRGGGPTPRGGGILASGASPTIRDNTLYLNTAGTSTGGGGSGIWLESGADALIDGNSFINNTAVGPSPGTIQVVDSDPIITNNILYRELGGAAIVCEGTSDPTIRFNDFFGNPLGDIVCADPDTSNNLININPLLCDPDAGVFTLFDESFLIGAGENGRTIGAFGPGCHATIKYVTTSGPSVYPYFTPAQAADSIGTVLALAVPGDTIRVASGVYDERIVIPAGVYVQGNWNQSFSEREAERDPSALDGGGAGSVVTFPADSGVSAGIDGFAITDGFAAAGSAVLIQDASPVLRGLTIVLNANETDDGGVVEVSGGSPEIVNTIVAFNRGAGVACLGGASIDIHHSGLFNNTGGAVEGCPEALPANVLLEDPLFCNVQGCILDTLGRWDCDFNTRDFHLFGESRYRDGGENGARIGALRVNCNRSSHFVSATGGDVFPYVTAAGATPDLSAAIAVASPGDTVRVAVGRYDGSIELKDGVRLEGGWNATFTNRDPEAFESMIRGVVADAPTIFATSSNISEETQVTGFTITHAPGVFGPGIAIADSAAPIISWNVIRGNASTSSGAGIVNDGGLAVFSNNTIVQNTTTSTDSVRAAGVQLRNIQNGFVFRRNIIYDNRGGNGMACASPFATQARGQVAQNILFANEGTGGGAHPDSLSFCVQVSRTQNLIVDPLFCDYAAGDLSIDFDSPASDGACGDSLIGARGIGCFEHPHTFYLSAGNEDAGFPFGSPGCAAPRLSDVLPLMQAGDSLLVSAGTYPVDVTPLTVVNGTTLLGEFTADFTSRGSVTTISGEARARCLFIPPGIDSTTIIDGFSFSKGRAGRGGGLYVSGGASPILRDISFREMIADTAGAAIYCAPGSSPKIRECFIAFNRRPNPISPMVTLDGSSAELSDCTFFDNLTIGIDILSDTPEVFNNMLFRNDRGGIRCGAGSTPILDHNLAFGNDDFDYQGCDLDPADGNLSEPPLFCDVNGDNLNLFDHSPAATGGRGGTTIGAFPVACVTSAHFVSSVGDSAYPYNTPQNATRRLQDALDVAARRGQVVVPLPFDTVYVAGNVYLGDIVIPPHVTVLGGYDPNFNIIGTDSTFDARQRDITLFPVTVQGSGQGSVATVDSGGLYFTTVVDGLVFRGGRADQGGGIFIEPGGAATFRDCSVEDCAATVAGGAVYISPGPESNFEFFSALRDTAPLGAALYADSTRSLVTNCTIVDNVATAAGGAAVQFGTGELTNFARNIIAENQGIGLLVDRSLSAGVFQQNVFWMNSVADTSLPAPLPSTNVVADPRFCDDAGGDFTVNYESPAVLAPCARPPFEVAGRYAVGCTDPGHTFLARKSSGSPQYPYACPATATPKIVDAAVRASDGDTIRVAGETGAVGSTYEENIVINDRVVFLGGWDSEFTARNPLTNITRITSLNQGSLLTMESPKDGLGAVVESLAIDTTAIVSGFIFEDGNAGLANGGAILCIDASPRIVDNIFKENTTLNAGGAICAIRSKDQPIRSNRIFGNSAANGAGIYLDNCESPIVDENIIYSNRGSLRGGGIRLAQYTGSPSIHDNTIASNTGEGISFAGGSSAGAIYNNIVAYNTRVGMQQYPAPASGLAPAQHHNLHWSNVGGNFEGTEGGAGDVFLAPLFCARPAANYGLQECSPAIGAGADSADPIIGHLREGDPLCPDTLAATASIRFLKNSIVPRFVDVYVTVSERVVDSTLVVTKTCENSASVPFDVVPADSTGTVFGFQGLETSNCGELRIDVSALDLCENRAVASRTISTAVVAAGGAAVVQNNAAGARLEIVDAPAGGERIVMLASAPSDLVTGEEDPALASLGAPVGAACEAIGIESFAGAASLHLRVPEGIAREDAPALALYRGEGDGWVREASWLDESGGAIVAHPTADGVYRLVLTNEANASAKLPARLALHQNTPNPAPGRTSIAFDLPSPSAVTLAIFDVSGRRVANLVQKTLPAGRHAFTWDGKDHSGKDVPSGIYFYELSSSKAKEVRKLVVLR